MMPSLSRLLRRVLNAIHLSKRRNVSPLGVAPIVTEHPNIDEFFRLPQELRDEILMLAGIVDEEFKFSTVEDQSFVKVTLDDVSSDAGLMFPYPAHS